MFWVSLDDKYTRDDPRVSHSSTRHQTGSVMLTPVWCLLCSATSRKFGIIFGVIGCADPLRFNSRYQSMYIAAVECVLAHLSCDRRGGEGLTSTAACMVCTPTRGLLNSTCEKPGQRTPPLTSPLTSYAYLALPAPPPSHPIRLGGPPMASSHVTAVVYCKSPTRPRFSVLPGVVATPLLGAHTTT